MEIKLLSQNNEIFVPLTTAEAVLMKDKDEIKRLDVKLKEMDLEILSHEHVYNPVTESLIIGNLTDGTSSSVLSEYKSEYDLSIPETRKYMFIELSEYDESSKSTKIKGMVLIPIKLLPNLVNIQYNNYNFGGLLLTSDVTIDYSGANILFIPLGNNYIVMNFTDYIWITNIKLS